MRILAVDTSTMAGGVALIELNCILCDLRVDVRTSHAPRLLSLIHQALALTSVPLASIDLFAASQGPGSFTGLRIGLATLMGLARALNRTVVGVDTLEALAMKVPFAAFPVCPLLDARKGEVFGAIFRVTAQGLRRLTPNLVLSPEAFCGNITEPTILLGPGVEVYRDIWQARLGERAIFAPTWLGMPCSVEVGALALTQATTGHGGLPSGWTPTYVRASEAEINWSHRPQRDRRLP
jgi:tRNA threonylcarbamoyladenosine biosynthesis protein TsaB